MQSEIRIEGLEYDVYLGWNAEEREALRQIQISIHLFSPVLPRAVLTDELTDTLCYQTIETALTAAVQHKTFRLLEHLGYFCYECIKPLLPEGIEFSLSVCKDLGEKRGTRAFVIRSSVQGT